MDIRENGLKSPPSVGNVGSRTSVQVKEGDKKRSQGPSSLSPIKSNYSVSNLKSELAKVRKYSQAGIKMRQPRQTEAHMNKFGKSPAGDGVKSQYLKSLRSEMLLR